MSDTPRPHHETPSFGNPDLPPEGTLNTVDVSVTINGAQRSATVEARTLLVHYIRDHLGLTGTHWGCDTSNCGVCVVSMNGVPVKSCTVLAV